ncbi:DMT family transporter [Leisingera sp. ANG-M1]|uniref:DMT family transporter n=1 Tax=Leisingera sp. ANG-M1 TaxID=1577895 RepID=UPI000690C36F|nr:DMT family transporter [Leisingera sp. ANG-M1]
MTYKAGPSTTAGVITIIATVFAMALTDAFVKYSSADMGLWQIYVLRSACVLPVFAVFARRAVWPGAARWVAARSLALVLMYLAIYAAIPVLDLSVIAATLYLGPLFIVCLSAVLLGQRILALHWGAITLGFLGVLAILRPAADVFDALSLIPMLAAFLYAVAAVMTRAKCATENPATLALWLNAALLVFGLLATVAIHSLPPAELPDYPFLFGGWSAMTKKSWGIIAVLAVLIIVVSIGLARAYQSPKPEVIAAFDYSYLIFAAFWGFVFFGERPDMTTLLGMLLVLAAGLLSLVADKALDQAGKNSATSGAAE